jgi:DNA-binding MarR family transcriptional regulator
MAMGQTDKPSAATTLDLRVWVRLLDCAKIIEKRLRRNFEEQFGTTLPRFDILATLDRAPDGLRMGELSRALLVSNGNVTAIVRQLQEQALVEARPDPEDGRSAIVSLTPTGRVQFTVLAEAHHGWVREALAEFPEASQRHLLDLLTHLKLSIA